MPSKNAVKHINAIFNIIIARRITMGNKIMKNRGFKILGLLLFFTTVSINCHADGAVSAGDLGTTEKTITTITTYPLMSRYFAFSVSEIIPIGDGNVLMGDTASNRILNMNLSSGNASQTWQLNSAPDHIQYDADNGYIYASSDAAADIARINTDTDEIEYLQVVFDGTEPVEDIVLGEAGELYVYHAEFVSITITIVDSLDWEIITTQTDFNGDLEGSAYPPYYSPITAYNKEENMFYVANRGISAATLTRLSYDTEAQEFTSVESTTDLGSNGQDIVVSNDGAHLLFFVGGGNGDGYTVFDIDPTSIDESFGEWDLGAYPRSGDISIGDDTFIGVNGDEIVEFSLSTHGKLNTWDLADDVKRAGSDTDCDYNAEKLLRYSPSAENAYLLTECGFDNDGAEITWFEESITTSTTTVTVPVEGGGSASLALIMLMGLAGVFGRKR